MRLFAVLYLTLKLQRTIEQETYFRVSFDDYEQNKDSADVILFPFEGRSYDSTISSTHHYDVGAESEESFTERPEDSRYFSSTTLSSTTNTSYTGRTRFPPRTEAAYDTEVQASTAKVNQQELTSSRGDIFNNTGRKKCIEKVETVEEFEEYLETICDHTYTKQCHTTFLTKYNPIEVKECEDNYIKHCYISYEDIAVDEVVTICVNPVVRDCQLESSQQNDCTIEYQTVCETVFETKDTEEDEPDCMELQEISCEENFDNQTSICRELPRIQCKIRKKIVKKRKPSTACHQEGVSVCGSTACEAKEEGPVCWQENKVIPQELPVEDCTLESVKSCKFVTQLVPYLEPTTECIDVPKELCSTVRSKGRKVLKPILKTWCYIPSLESELYQST